MYHATGTQRILILDDAMVERKCLLYPTPSIDLNETVLRLGLIDHKLVWKAMSETASRLLSRRLLYMCHSDARSSKNDGGIRNRTQSTQQIHAIGGLAFLLSCNLPYGLRR